MKKQLSLLTLNTALLFLLSSSRIQSAAELPAIHRETDTQSRYVIDNENFQEARCSTPKQSTIAKKYLQTTQKNRTIATLKLVEAIITNDTIVAQEAISEHADINTTLCGGSLLTEAVHLNNPAMIDLLLKHNADPNGHTSNKHSALIWATRQGHVALVTMLLEHKANPNEQDDHLFTPLMYTTFNHQPDIIEPLILHGADPDIASLLGQRALDFATPSTKKLFINALQKKVIIDLHAQNWELETLINSHLIEQYIIPELACLICAYANPYYTTREPLYGIIQQHIQNNIKQTQAKSYVPKLIPTPAPIITHTATPISTVTSTPTLCCAHAPRCNCAELKQKTISCNQCIIS